MQKLIQASEHLTFWESHIKYQKIKAPKLFIFTFPHFKKYLLHIIGYFLLIHLIYFTSCFNLVQTKP